MKAQDSASLADSRQQASDALQMGSQAPSQGLHFSFYAFTMVCVGMFE